MVPISSPSTTPTSTRRLSPAATISNGLTTWAFKDAIARGNPAEGYGRSDWRSAIIAILAIFASAPRSRRRPVPDAAGFDGSKGSDGTYCALHPAETPHLRHYAAEGISARGADPRLSVEHIPEPLLHRYRPLSRAPRHHQQRFLRSAFGPVFPLHTAGRCPRLALVGRRADLGHGRETGPQERVKLLGQDPRRRSRASVRLSPSISISQEYQPDALSRPVDEVVGWLRLPPICARPSSPSTSRADEQCRALSLRPRIHPELAAAVKLLDGRLGALMDRLEAEHLPVNLIVVSDHGMTAVSPDRIVVLDDYLDPGTVQIDFQSPAMGLRPLSGTAREIIRRLAHLSHAKAYLTDNLPPRSGSAGLQHEADVRIHAADYLPAGAISSRHRQSPHPGSLDRARGRLAHANAQQRQGPGGARPEEKELATTGSTRSFARCTAF